jgi:hypothetical protein
MALLKQSIFIISSLTLHPLHAVTAKCVLADTFRALSDNFPIPLGNWLRLVLPGDDKSGLYLRCLFGAEP